MRSLKRKLGLAPTGGSRPTKTLRALVAAANPPAAARRRRAAQNIRTGGFMGMERKFLDTAFNGVAVTAPTDSTGGEIQPTAGCTNCMSVPAEGNTQSSRDGRKYVIKSVALKGMIDWTFLQDQADPSTVPQVFIAVVLDSQTNAQAINSEDVFTNPLASAATQIQPHLNLANSGRFRVLWSKLFQPSMPITQQDSLVAATAAYIPYRNQTFKMFKKLNVPVNCRGTTANVSSVSDNSISVIAFASSTSCTPTIFATGRVRFEG